MRGMRIMELNRKLCDKETQETQEKPKDPTKHGVWNPQDPSMVYLGLVY